MIPVRKNISLSKSMGALTAGVLTCATALPSIAGMPQKWEEVPKAVRDTVLTNGGKEGPVDLEIETKDGRAILGVRCVVAHISVRKSDRIAEDTYEWFAQDKRGAVWCFGNATREIGAGGRVSTEASWQAGNGLRNRTDSK